MAAAAVDVDRALEAALKENAKLKKRLAKLQRIESGLDAKDESASSKQRETQREACKTAFDEFDVDKSGFIEINELALLATELNAPLNSTELVAAHKALDLNGDGKISFDEFYRWWTSGAAATAGADGDKNPIAIALLRARLLSHKSKKLIDQMASEAKKGAAAPKAAATASASTATATAVPLRRAPSVDSKAAPAVDQKADPFAEAVPSDARVHSSSLSVGDFEVGSKAKASINFAFKNDLVADPSILAADPKFGTFVSLDIRTTGKPDFVPYLQNIAKSFSRSLAEYVTFAVSAPAKDIARVTVGIAVPIPDPSELLVSLGVEPETLARMMVVRVEFAHTLTDLLDPKQALNWLDFLHFRVDSRVVLEPSLIKALGVAAAAAPGGGGRGGPKEKLQGMLPFLSLWDTRVNLRFGDLKALLEEAVATAGGQLPLPKALTNTKQPLCELAEKKLREQLQRDRRGELRAGASGFRILLLTLARDFAEIIGLSAWTRAGLGVQLSLDGMLNVAALLDTINWVDAIANPQK